MKYVRRIQRNGVVTVPKELRQKLRIRQGDLVMLSYSEGRIMIATFQSEVVPLPLTPDSTVRAKPYLPEHTSSACGDDRAVSGLQQQKRLWPRAA